MNCHAYEVSFPANACELDQDEEYIILKEGATREKVLLHDYKRFFEVPGLYEEVLYKRLKCCSPKMLCALLDKAMEDSDDTVEPLRVLDFGAGNGVAGDHVKEAFACDTLVGVDIETEARKAAFRDRPDLYDDYLIADFTALDSREKDKLEGYDFNILLSIAALGYDHIGTKAFLNAFELVADDAWVAFNIKDRFLSDEDATGFKETVETLMQDRMQVLESQRYVHRYSITEEPLHYVGIIGKKTQAD